jgi:hypothetical protein
MATIISCRVLKEGLCVQKYLIYRILVLKNEKDTVTCLGLFENGDDLLILRFAFGYEAKVYISLINRQVLININNM